MFFLAFDKILVLLLVFFYQISTSKSIEILIFLAFGNCIPFKKHSLLVISVCLAKAAPHNSAIFQQTQPPSA